MPIECGHLLPYLHVLIISGAKWFQVNVRNDPVPMDVKLHLAPL
jgi:hypothetical protein